MASPRPPSPLRITTTAAAQLTHASSPPPLPSTSSSSPHALLTTTLESLLDVNHLTAQLEAATTTVHQLAASRTLSNTHDLEAQRHVLGKSLVGLRSLVLDKLNEVQTLVGQLDQVVRVAQDTDVDMTQEERSDDVESAQRQLDALRKEWLDNSATLRDLELDMHEFRGMVSVLLTRIKQASSPPPPAPTAA